jgi:hypothetical protein
MQTSRFDIVDVIRADEIEGAGFRREHVGFAVLSLQLAKSERPETVRISRHNHAVPRQRHQRKCAFQLQQSFPQRTGQRSLARPDHRLQNHFGIAGC